jgi:hypothetical protein
MSKPGVIFKRCGCRDTTGRRLEQRCQRLDERGHGSWYFHACAANVLGRSELVRRGGYPSQAAARRARHAWLAATGEQRSAGSWTVERWLRYWLTTRAHLRPTSLLHYTRGDGHADIHVSCQYPANHRQRKDRAPYSGRSLRRSWTRGHRRSIRKVPGGGGWCGTGRAGGVT